MFDNHVFAFDSTIPIMIKTVKMVVLIDHVRFFYTLVRSSSSQIK